jgi:hypothetical protein
MKNYTIEAIKNQLNALNAKYYNIGLFNYISKTMDERIKLSISQILQIIPWLQYQNKNNENIFIKPNKDENRALILIDDINAIHINNMKKRGINPACIIETSPCNFQVWISLGEESMPNEQRKFISKIFCQEFFGDPGCVAGSHYGRLAGFTNRKQEYYKQNIYPFVFCRESTGQHAKKSKQIREWILKQEEINLNKKSSSAIKQNNELFSSNIPLNHIEIFKKYFEQWEITINFKQFSYDASRGDFAVCCRMIQEGYSVEQISEGLIKNSPDILIRKKNHIDDYINRTIDAALNYTINRR